MPLLYLFCRSCDIFLSIYWLHTIPLCHLIRVLKFINYIISLLNHLVFLVIRCSWDILSIIFVRSRFIVYSTKSSRGPVDRVTFFCAFNLVHQCIFLISSVESTYIMTISVPILFTLYKIQGSVLNCLNPYLRVIVLMYSLNQKCAACTRTHIDLIGVNISSYI